MFFWFLVENISCVFFMKEDTEKLVWEGSKVWFGIDVLELDF